MQKEKYFQKMNHHLMASKQSYRYQNRHPAYCKMRGVCLTVIDEIFLYQLIIIFIVVIMVMVFFVPLVFITVITIIISGLIIPVLMPNTMVTGNMS